MSKNIQIGDTIKLNFTDSKTKLVTPGFGFIIGIENVAEGINSYNMFFYKKGNLYNFKSSTYSGSFVNCKILLIEKIYKTKSKGDVAAEEIMHLIRDIQDTIPRGFFR